MILAVGLSVANVTERGDVRHGVFLAEPAPVLPPDTTPPVVIPPANLTINLAEPAPVLPPDTTPPVVIPPANLTINL